jgi:peptidyl-dipeptidase Dcp
LSLQFGENILAENQCFPNAFVDEKDLAGFRRTIEAARSLAKAQKKLVFTLDHPSYVPFMTYADNRELRKKISNRFWRKRISEKTNLTTKKLF